MTAELIHGEGFSVSLQRMEGFLRAHVFGGRDSLEVSIAMWRLLGRECERRGIRKLLVVEDLDAGLDMAEIEQLIDAVVDYGFRGMQVAFVDLRQETNANEHGEILAVERGVTGRVFPDEAQARRWLRFGAEAFDIA